MGRYTNDQLSEHAPSGISLRRWPAVVVGVFCVLALVPGVAFAQKDYPSPEAAADAFTAALESGLPEAMNEVLGDDFRRFIPTEQIDQALVSRYLDAWQKRHAIVSSDNAALEGAKIVAVGEGDWTLPIPLVKSEAGWRFAVIEGADEMKTRRVGRNELAVIGASLAYCDAQREYNARDRNGNGRKEFAQRIISTPGQTDGLYWARLDDAEEESPLGPYFGNDDIATPYHGYQYRILKTQGANAPGGAIDYVVDGAMTEGFALVAWPARYDDTGVMTFIVNGDNVVFEADLGEDTDARARAIEGFDPDPAIWSVAQSSEGG